MSNLRPHNGPTTKLVMAFDVGTTFSGISYCILEPGRSPEILGVTKFPGQPPPGGDAKAKVPSILYYDKTGTVRAAGAEVLSEAVIETALEEKWTKAEWWKLHLRPKHLVSTIDQNDLPPLPPGKNPVDILTDFIHYLFSCAKTYIQESHIGFSWSLVEDNIEYIFTHPNGWEGVQQQLYRQAIARAGLIPSTPEGQACVHMLSEGEASLHFCLVNLLGTEMVDQANPQGVVFIDAGGATIDLSMFLITTNPIFCEEVVPPECRLQGSVYVTHRARVLLRNKLEGWEHSSPAEIDEIMHEFDQTTKLAIKSDEESAFIKVASRQYDNPEYNISFGRLKLTGEEATGLFKESLDAIVDAFEQQLESTVTPITITCAFIVGGLSTNDWLWSQLLSYFKDKNINAVRPDDHINKAVANGAVLSRIDCENHTVTSRVARATYGVVYALPVEENNKQHMHRKNRWQRDPAGNAYVPGRFNPTLRKGDPVRAKKGFRYPFSLTEMNLQDFGMQTMRIVCYQGGLPIPQWVDEDQPSFSIYCTIRVNLGDAKDAALKQPASGKDRKATYQLDYDVIVLFGLTEIQAYLCWKTSDGERRTPAKIIFES